MATGVAPVDHLSTDNDEAAEVEDEGFHKFWSALLQNAGWQIQLKCSGNRGFALITNSKHYLEVPM